MNETPWLGNAPIENIKVQEANITMSKFLAPQQKMHIIYRAAAGARSNFV
jgi:hypothetical protein